MVTIINTGLVNTIQDYCQEKVTARDLYSEVESIERSHTAGFIPSLLVGIWCDKRKSDVKEFPSQYRGISS